MWLNAKGRVGFRVVLTQLLTSVIQDQAYFCICLPLAMSLHFQWSYFGCSQPPGLCFHSDLRTANEDCYPNIFRRSEDTYLPGIPQQTWSAGLLLTPDATALAREWEPIINVDPNHLPHRSSQKWNQLLPANGLPAGGVATYVNSGFLRERETISFVGGGERQRDELIHTPDYI